MPSMSMMTVDDGRRVVHNAVLVLPASCSLKYAVILQLYTMPLGKPFDFQLLEGSRLGEDLDREPCAEVCLFDCDLHVGRGGHSSAP